MIPESGAITSLLNTAITGLSLAMTAALQSMRDRRKKCPDRATRHKLPGRFSRRGHETAAGSAQFVSEIRDLSRFLISGGACARGGR